MKNFNLVALFLLLTIASFSQVPVCEWAKTASGSSVDEANCITTDLLGNVYVTGTYASSVLDFGTVELTITEEGYGDAYLVKYDPAGDVTWAKNAGGLYLNGGKAVTTDISGNVYLTGYFMAPTLVFGDVTLTNSGDATREMFLVKFDTGGNVVWAKSDGGTGNQSPNSISVDVSGNIFVTGVFDGIMTIGSTTLANTGSESEMFVIKYNPAGNSLWAKSAGGTSFSTTIATDLTGNAFVTGSFRNPTLVFGATTLTNAGNSDMFLVKYDPNGDVLWAKSAGEAGWEDANGLVTDASGNVYIAGTYSSSSIEFESNTLTAEGNGDIYFVKYAADGDVIWAKKMGGSGYESTPSLTADEIGNIYVTGSFTSNIFHFEASALNYEGDGSNNDMFFIKCDQSGNLIWSKTYTQGAAYNITSTKSDASGNLYFTGMFNGGNLVLDAITIANPALFPDIYLAKLGNNSVGISQINEINQITIFPNPSSVQFSIFFPGNEKTVSVRIIDFLGREIRTTSFTGENVTVVNDNLAKGVYFILGLTEDKTPLFNKKMIIQ